MEILGTNDHNGRSVKMPESSIIKKIGKICDYAAPVATLIAFFVTAAVVGAVMAIAIARIIALLFTSEFKLSHSWIGVAAAIGAVIGIGIMLRIGLVRLMPDRSSDGDI